MSNTSPELSAKREQLKRQLATGKDRTLAALIFFKAGRIVGLLTRRHKPVPWYYGAIFIGLILLLAFPLVLAPVDKTNQKEVLQGIVGVLFMYQCLIGTSAAYWFMGWTFGKIRDHVIDHIVSEDDLTDLKNWLADTGSVRKSLSFVVVLGIAWGLFSTVSGGATQGRSIISTVGPYLYGLFIMVPVYYIWMVLRLPPRLGRYRFSLNKFDPANSEVISHLAQLLNRGSFIIAVFSAISTLMVGLTIIALARGWWLSVGPILAGWIPVLILFISTQSAFRKIVTTAKRSTLNELQAQIDKLLTAADLANKETQEAITRLMDLYERIKATPNSTFTVLTGLGVLKDLLLPVLASVLTNYEQLRKLLP